MATILVLDDCKETLALFSVVLGAEGFNTKTVSSKYQLKDELLYCIPDLIILDVLLSGANGRDICKEIKTTMYGRKIPVILISSNHKWLENFEECLADDVIQKPIDIDIVSKKIKSLLDKE